ncbi:MAG: Coenzyme F420 hydrogenase/dehydrogenase, beta subunit C-terminal domain [Muribaculaceae bacterium]|nr:Coenzyme F420 hydrogenase/dehydrogenase, beta subunit C-terminal domain [Muribaculaceae bacterium]
MPELATDKTCTGCMGCLNVCPKDAISTRTYPDGHLGISVDPDRCIECRMCEKVCPVVNGIPYGENSLKSRFLAGWAQDTEIRRRGATSGIAGAIAARVVADGGYAAGAVMEGLECRYTVTSDPAELPRLQGSKYTASMPGTVMRRIRQLLSEGKQVFFCGLPCHVAALLNYIPEKLHPLLLTADIICGGVSSPLLLKRYAEEHPEMTGVASFRNKDHGWHPKGYRYNLKYVDAEGTVHDTPSGTRNLITDGFACELTDRRSCYDCRFAFTHRRSDLTLGDLWGDTRFPAQHHDGVSAIIAHSPRGEEILRMAGIAVSEIPAADVLGHNTRLFYGKSVKRFLPERRLLPRLIRRLSYPALLRVYASDLRGAPWYWMPFALYRVVSFRIAEKIKQLKSRYIIRHLTQD